ncbi:BTAD domain-containing putative transcriptional regulator [Amycolatopsis minnesotensis]|uniref:BTAD domain-containing putative transcriptional regulator n=1 Tax=Amycolatopsis minnesotensis TaxID=337894 RepID=A0ABN2QIQ4_9PSEU
MRFAILGPVQATRADGSEVLPGGPRGRALLTLLALDAGRIVPAERLIDGLYGERPPDGAPNALQSQVSRLRSQLGVTIEHHSAGYRLALAGDDQVDAREFAKLAADGKSALAAGEHDEAARLLGEALALWRGRALADVPSAEAQATRLEEERLAVTEDHVEARLRVGEHEALLPPLRELASEHPLRERFHAQLVRALHASGKPAEALTAFEHARRTLADELGADPSPELAAAHLAVLTGEQPRVTARRGLPAQLTSFVGRQDDLDRIEARLTGHRLVTLTGPGGAGKTRLALEAAARSRHDVHLVQLAPLTDGEDVPQTTLTALGLRDTDATGRSTTPPADRLVAALADRPVLLVFDNCEHVIDDAAALAARLLAACPRLRLLATSREPLGITGEDLVAVSRLAVPPPGTPAGRVLEFPAVRLFADRAAAGGRDLVLDAGIAEHVRRVCAALDGLPLAIELAAARVRTLPIEEISARLDDRFGLLAKGSRTADARHRGLRAVVEWSWDLLDDDERALAMRLSVFAGGATISAIDAIAEVSGLPSALELLTGLVDKSFAEIGGDRYRMLETIKAFCAERLAEAGETERFHRAHAEYHLALATEAGRHILTADQLGALAKLDVEHDELLGALRWAIEADHELALRLIGALSAYWLLRGKRFEGAALSRELTERLAPEQPEDLREEYLLCLLHAVHGVRDTEAVRARIDAASTGTRQRLPSRWPVLSVLNAMFAGPPPDARYDDYVDVSQIPADDAWGWALVRVGEGLTRLYHGRPADAIGLLTDGLARFRVLGERWGLSITLTHLAQIVSWQGDQERALTLLDEAIELTGLLGSMEETADLVRQRADCLLRLGDRAGARAGYLRAVELASPSGALDKLAEAHLALANLHRLEGDHAEAARLCALALEECPRAGFSSNELPARVHHTMGRIGIAEGRLTEAAALIGRAVEVARRTDNAELTACTVEALAEIALVEGDAARAARLLGAGASVRGMSISGDPDIERVTAGVAKALGDAFDIEYANGRALRSQEVLTIPAGTR